MNNSTKSRLAIDLDALEQQLKNVHNQSAPRQRKADPLAELARIVGQEDPYRAMLAGDRPAAADDDGKKPLRRESRPFGDDHLDGRQPAAADDGTRPSAHLQEPVFTDASLRGSLREPSAREPYPRDFPPTTRANGDFTDSHDSDEHRDGNEHHYVDKHHDGDEDEARDSQSEKLVGEQDATADDEVAEPPADDEPPRSWRKRLVTVAAFTGVAVVGVAAAFVFKGSGIRAPAGEPPTIMAEQAPIKVPVKNPADEAAGQNKQIYERAAQSSTQDTKVVNRDEQPVDINQALRQSSAPQGSAAADGATRSVGVSLPQPPQASNLASKPDEPKKVKIVSVRPDGSIVNEAQPVEPALPKASAQAPAQAKQSQAAAQSGSLANPLAVSQKSQARVGDPSEKIDGRTPDSRSSDSRSLAPLNITPSSANAQKPAANPKLAKVDKPAAAEKAAASVEKPAANDQKPAGAEKAAANVDNPVASVQKPAGAEKVDANGDKPVGNIQKPPARAEKPATKAPPRRVVAAAEEPGTARAATASEGGFAVQLAASPSEKEARETFASLQRKHPELSGRQAIIRQAQVGGKTLWRVRVAAPSKEVAVSLCTKLQAAGGACFPVKN